MGEGSTVEPQYCGSITIYQKTCRAEKRIAFPERVDIFIHKLKCFVALQSHHPPLYRTLVLPVALHPQCSPQPYGQIRKPLKNLMGSELANEIQPFIQSEGRCSFTQTH